MEAGVSSFALGWAVSHGAPPLDETGLLSFASRNGLRIVQFGDNLPVHRLDPDHRTALRKRAQASGVILELGARGLTEDHLSTYLGLCQELGAELLRFVADQGDYQPSPADLTALLRNAVSSLENAGVTVGLENHDRLPAAVLRQIIDDVASSQVGICLDTANSLGAGEGLEAVTELLGPVTVNCHLKDIIIRRQPHLMGFVIEGCPLGRGQLPLRRTLERLRATGRCETIVLEAWCPPLPNMEETVQREREWADDGITTLKQWLTEMV